MCKLTIISHIVHIQGNNARRRRRLSDDSAAATAAVLLSGFRCIAKEADLISELLRRGAYPMYYLIVQSNLIRMCALSLMMNSCWICDPVAAAASMVGITKETATMCEWMQEHHGVVFDPSSLSLPLSYEFGRIIRYRTLHFMTSVLEKSPMPSAYSAVAVVPGSAHMMMPALLLWKMRKAGSPPRIRVRRGGSKMKTATIQMAWSLAAARKEVKSDVEIKSP